MSIPKTMKAVVIEEGKFVVKDNVPVPKANEDCLLVRTKAVGSNPFEGYLIDWKLGAEGSIVGSDLVGEIVYVGANVDPKKFQIGNAICTVVNGGAVNYIDNGAYAEYVRVQPAITFKFPQSLSHCDKTTVGSSIFNTWESCASFPVVFCTALGGIFCELNLKLEWEPKTPQNDHPILIWGGATGVGQYAIQLVKHVHGFTKIIVVASKKHEEMLKSFGADDVFDYHDDTVVEQITTKYDNLQTLMDCKSSVSTIQQTYKSASHFGKVRLMHYQPANMDCIDTKDQRDNIEMMSTKVYSMNDVPVVFGPVTMPANPTYRNRIIECVNFFNPKLVSGDIKHTPLKIYKGLEGAIEMVDDIRHGKNSGMKFVAQL